MIKRFKDFIKNSFYKMLNLYFWHFMAFLAGIITSGIAIHLAK